MARFVFELEGVLRHRKNIEHERQRDVAEVQAHLSRVEAELRALDAEVQGVNNDVRQYHLSGKIETGFLIAHRRFLASAQKQAMAIAQRMADVQVKLESARRALIEAAKACKILEKLKERQLEAWKQNAAYKESQVMNELTAQHTYRSMLAAADERTG